MESVRALALLTALESHTGFDALGTEESELEGFGFAAVLDAGQAATVRAGALNATGELGKLRETLRQLAGKFDPASRAQLREAAARFEAGVVAEQRLAHLVANPTTSHTVVLTELGERAVEDLSCWAARLPGVPVAAALPWLDRLRLAFETDVRRATVDLDRLTGSNFLDPQELQHEFAGRLPPGRKLGLIDLDPVQRSAAAVLGMAGVEGIGSPASVNARRQVLHDASASPLLPMAAALVSVAQAAEVLTDTHGQLLPQVTERFGPGPESPLVAAALADVPYGELPVLFARSDDLRGRVGSSDPFVLLTLARTLLPTEVAAARYTGILGALPAAGTAEDRERQVAAAVLAASIFPTDEAVRRLRQFEGWLAGALASPMVAAATMAAFPFEPPEIWFLYKEAAAAVARGRFFDTVLEVDKLGLLFTAHLLLAPFGSDGPPSRAPSVSPSSAGQAGFLWEARFALFQDLPVVADVLAHPEHAHTVAGFG